MDDVWLNKWQGRMPHSKLSAATCYPALTHAFPNTSAAWLAAWLAAEWIAC